VSEKVDLRKLGISFRCWLALGPIRVGKDVIHKYIRDKRG
jgi:hypothetical protein